MAQFALNQCNFHAATLIGIRLAGVGWPVSFYLHRRNLLRLQNVHCSVWIEDNDPMPLARHVKVGFVFDIDPSSAGCLKRETSKWFLPDSLKNAACCHFHTAAAIGITLVGVGWITLAGVGRISNQASPILGTRFVT